MVGLSSLSRETTGPTLGWLRCPEKRGNDGATRRHLVRDVLEKTVLRATAPTNAAAASVPPSYRYSPCRGGRFLLVQLRFNPRRQASSAGAVPARSAACHQPSSGSEPKP